MASRRMIASDIFEDDFFISLDTFARLLWIGLIVRCADDQGRLQDNAILIKSQIFPADNIDPKIIESLLEAYHQVGKAYRYVADGKKLIQIVNWWKYQTPVWANKSKYPAPANWIDREKYHAGEKKIVTRNWDLPGGFAKHVTNPVTNPVTNGLNEVNVNDKHEMRGDENTKDPEATDDDGLFDALRMAIESRGILPAGEKDVTSIIELVNCGVTKEDLLAGIDWKAGNNNGKPVRYVSQVVGPAKTAMAKRLQNVNGHTPGGEFKPGEDGRVLL